MSTRAKLAERQCPSLTVRHDQQTSKAIPTRCAGDRFGASSEYTVSNPPAKSLVVDVALILTKHLVPAKRPSLEPLTYATPQAWIVERHEGLAIVD
jgi:hypothetical protein